MSILAIDAGTTGVTAVVISPEGAITTRGYQEFGQHFPRPGWVEHSPEEIWQATLEATRQVLDQVDASDAHRSGHHQPARDRAPVGPGDPRPPRRAIVWQDRRTADLCARLRKAGHEDRVASSPGCVSTRTSRPPSSPGCGSTIRTPGRWWSRDATRWAPSTPTYRPDDPGHVARHRRLERLPHPALRPADRRLVRRALPLFGVPRDALPEIVPSWGEVGVTDPAAFCGLSLPVAGIAGDQQAALFGQTCFEEGDTKCTYGTGSFILTNAGTDAPPLRHGAALHRGLAQPRRDPDLCAGGLDLRHRRRGPVAA